ncbi:MAG: type II secretion system protein GspN [Bdellovibrionales bacterium]|nr:type II secretion system protein GspN [Bdellovibrionales bacterium]
MSEAIQKFIFVLKNKKLLIFKVFLTYLLSLIIFSMLMFPFSYLSSYLTTAVAKATGNQVFLKSKDIHLSLIPAFGVELENVELETVQLPKMEAKRIIISPSLISLITDLPKMQNPQPGAMPVIPDVSLKLYDFLGSDTEAQVNKTDGKQRIVIKSKNLELKQLSSLDLLPIRLIGELNLNLNSLVDPSFKQQPEGDIEISIAKLTIPSTNIAIPNLGSIPLPKLSISDVRIKGRISDGRLIIEQAKMGKPNEKLNLELIGQLTMSLVPSARGPRMNWGAYSLQTVFNIDSKLANDLLLEAVLGKHKVKETNQKMTFGIRMTGRSFRSPPTTRDKIDSLPKR